MGKAEEEQSLSSAVIAEILEQNVENPCRIRKFVRFRCVLALLFGAAVFLSVIFWLPPFFHYRDRGDLDPDSQFRDYDIVASFKVSKPVSLLKANILELEIDIFGEISIPNTTVVVISLEPLAGSTTTKVVFGVVPDAKYSSVSSADLSLIRSSFVSLVIQQPSLHLTQSLFGVPFSFEVLKFPGGITVIPLQRAFLLQKVQILFNFTLNFSIDQIQENFNELKNQLKSGLHLTSYEGHHNDLNGLMADSSLLIWLTFFCGLQNLYVSLTNLQGSTLAPPTTVQASVLLAIGNLPPPLPRLKQLAQTITGSPARNLGLNNTVFGRVKQVHLSSVLQNSLHNGSSSGTSWSPSPAPLPHPHHRHHHHHHHPHHQHHDVHLAPSVAPTPEKSYEAKPPSGCRIGFTRKARQPHLVPTFAPMISPHHSAILPPHRHVNPPAPALHMLPASSPLPAVVFAHVQPPRNRKVDVEPPDTTPSVSPLPSSCESSVNDLNLMLQIYVILSS
ncbi:hypothetical protein HHK36_017056 [Tetracentron sinense]|uniref:DUF7036 domain-containing protein n=1 Tax=Tetracentron sinense TaxID=13715 RepID=A0A834Z2F5_TETSI|nr:hypothetical protein HHK36_017056 [Tetracentron sinense]